ncbi:hypothetical protein cce_3948 [Crocosphaera subtropica ATCC 51142]|uniref:Uncharacterized protein n=1 Tax=Crocosphaera subtropica (strain ATCC 51142 / BH68) TaxID=43989 RepID=B1WPY1_CROS5|nr:hypothetical protein cce_3948 [Crocosphaera subtropica ATCC 51142]
MEVDIKLYTTISDDPIILKTNIPYPWEEDTCAI